MAESEKKNQDKNVFHQDPTRSGYSSGSREFEDVESAEDIGRSSKTAQDRESVNSGGGQERGPSKEFPSKG
jgi:hypothetical protein